MHFQPGTATGLAGLRAAAARLLYRLRLARRRLGDLNVRVFELDGMVRGRVAAKVLYGGRASSVREVQQFLFSGPVNVRDLGAATALNLQRRLRQLMRPPVDVLMWEAWPWETTFRHGNTSDSYVVQTWLDARANPGRDWEALREHTLSSNARRASLKATRGTLTVRMATSAAEREGFYDAMLLPMAKHLFGEDLFVPDAATYRATCATGHLLLAERAGQVVAGAWVNWSTPPGQLRLPHYGALPVVLEDNTLRREVMALINSWVFREACSRGLQVNLALTRPFLDDGVYNQKRQWGCWLQHLPAFERYRIQFVSERGDDVLRAAPFFHLTHAGVCGHMAYAPTGEDPVKELGTLLARAVFPGLQGITVRVSGAHALRLHLSVALPNVKGCPVWYVPGDLARTPPLHNAPVPTSSATSLEVGPREGALAGATAGAAALTWSGP